MLVLAVVLTRDLPHGCGRVAKSADPSAALHVSESRSGEYLPARGEGSGSFELVGR